MQYVVLRLQICVGVKSITNLFCVACTKLNSNVNTELHIAIKILFFQMYKHTDCSSASVFYIFDGKWSLFKIKR